MKFSALNIDFGGVSLDPLGSGRPMCVGVVESTSLQGRYLTAVGILPLAPSLGVIDSVAPALPLLFCPMSIL